MATERNGFALRAWCHPLSPKRDHGDPQSFRLRSDYPALHKLEQEGWISAEWKPSENNRRAKFYSLTRLGRKQLAKEAAKG